MDYAELQASVADWTARDDLAGKTPTFIRLGEAVLQRRVRTFEQEADATIICNAPDYIGALPARFLGFRRVSVDGSPGGAQYVPPSIFHEARNSPRDAFNELLGGAALLYTLESNAIKVAQAEGSNSPITLSTCFFQGFAPLSNDAPSNWLLAAHPDLYLWAALIEAWDWIDETEMVARYQSRLDRALGDLETHEKRKRQGAGPLVRSPASGGIV